MITVDKCKRHRETDGACLILDLDFDFVCLILFGIAACFFGARLEALDASGAS